MEENEQKSEFIIRFMKNNVYIKQSPKETNGTIYILEQNVETNEKENQKNAINNGTNSATNRNSINNNNQIPFNKNNHCFIGWNNDDDSQNGHPDSFSLLVPLSQLETIKRAIPPLNTHYIILTTKSGVSLNPYYFKQGGVKEFLTTLKNYVNLVKSELDNNLFYLNSFNFSSVLQSHGKHEPVQKESRFFDKFARITEFTRAVGPKRRLNKEIENKVNKTLDKIVSTQKSKRESLRSSSINEEDPLLTAVRAFEILESIPDVKREKELTLDQWNSFFDADGKITDEKAIRKLIFKGGINPAARSEVWKYLLGFYPWDSTKAEREKLVKEKNTNYMKWKEVCYFIDSQNDSLFTKFRTRKFVIEKDAVRTDRQIEIFQEDGSPYLQKLMEVLLIYSMFNFDLGYCQGMNDLAAPILYIMDDEPTTFWCFKGLMDKMAINFSKNQIGIENQLRNLIDLIQILDPELFNHFRNSETDNMYSAYRWILLDFKREFSFTDIQRIWEVFWSNHLTDNFNLFFACAILLKHRDIILHEKMNLDDLIKFSNSLANTLNVEETLINAEKLFYIYVAQIEHNKLGNNSSSPNLTNSQSNSQKNLTNPTQQT